MSALAYALIAAAAAIGFAAWMTWEITHAAICECSDECNCEWVLVERGN